jgi:hypothetical protein
MNRAQQLLDQLNRTCLDKKSFSKSAADAVIDHLASRGTLMFYYKCKICARYHLTSKEPREYNEAVHYKII